MDASLTKVGQKFRLGFERRLSHSPEKVWRVLTERELLKRWFPCDVEGEWQVGAPLRFIFLHGEGEGLPEEELAGEVLAVEYPRLLEYRWGTSRIRCELIPDDGGCRMLFSETLDDPSMGARNAAGWEVCLENLDLVLEGGAVAKFALDAWRAKFKRYVAKFEPTAGPQEGPPADHPAVVAEEVAREEG